MDKSVIVQPDAADNLSLAYVEVFVDDKKVETSAVAPFTYRWKLGAAGTYTMHVRAVDSAGNEAESERVMIRVKDRNTTLFFVPFH